jgi:ankyrin repeat protein
MGKALLFITVENQMNKCILLLHLFLILFIDSCAGIGQKDERWENQTIKNKNSYYFYNALSNQNVELVKRFLEAGADPNYCRGENGWVDSNPLALVSVFKTLRRIRNGETLPNPLPDEELIRLLVEAGANINERPYIWEIVYESRIENLGFFTASEGWIGHSLEYTLNKISYDEFVEQLNGFIYDTNRLIEAFIKHGADPDKLGHPYPFSYDSKVPRLNNKKANEYFNNGTRAIDVAIEKGIMREKQVDLLLQYTSLNEGSLKAAEKSNDPAMISKINDLWKMQNPNVD